jgi:hypothetical protein
VTCMSEVVPSGPDPPRGVGVSQARARELLTEGELEVLGRIPWASNVTLLAEVSHGDLAGLAVYKPARGERPLWDFPDGSLYRREVAAFAVSEELGWGLVPLTVARDGPFGLGSVQLYVQADPEVTAFDLLAAGHPALPRIATFDVVVNNADRKAGHCLQNGAQVWAIDHGVCFHTEPKLRTVLWDLAGQPRAGGRGGPPRRAWPRPPAPPATWPTSSASCSTRTSCRRWRRGPAAWPGSPDCPGRARAARIPGRSSEQLPTRCRPGRPSRIRNAYRRAGRVRAVGFHDRLANHPRARQRPI